MKNTKLRTHLDYVMQIAKECMVEQFPWENREAYALWLNQTHSFVQYSTRIVALTGSRFPQSRNHFHERFMAHCGEERGHETLLIDDIRALEMDPANLKVFPSAKAFYQCQHYWIEHVNPIAFFGYLLFLEGLACHHGHDIVQKVQKTFGPSPLSFLKVHAEEDQDHLEKALRLVDQVSPEEQDLIIENLDISAELYFKFLGDIQKQVKSNRQGQQSAA